MYQTSLIKAQFGHSQFGLVTIRPQLETATTPGHSVVDDATSALTEACPTNAQTQLVVESELIARFVGATQFRLSTQRS